MKRLLVISLILVQSLLQVSPAQTIELYAEDSYTPFSNANGSGMINNLVVAAYREMGVEVKIKVIPFARIIKWLENGKGLGGFSAVKTAASQETLLFGKEPVFDVVTKFFYAKARPINIEDEADLNNSNLDVGEVNGYMYHDAFYQYKFKRHIAQSDENLIKMLLLQGKRVKFIQSTCQLLKPSSCKHCPSPLLAVYS